MNIWQTPDWPLESQSATVSREREKKNVLRRGTKLSVVGSRVVLNGHQHSVASLSSLPKVVVLEVERCLGEPISVRDIVDSVHDKEGVSAGSIDVAAHSRVQFSIVGEVEDETRAGLGRHAGLGAFECDDVVAAAKYE